ncbi:S60 ribosomal protein L29 [Cavenderia fasciculata]|uniref:60S ribosomal protein L29 n=1 Tax=Cavenderia fasciculata TaxID=261658 RepID=F4Q6T4_CACFS|nr:S60 ribosomal protein L29 [Cavenderia fasciculata]EGG16594.1 S60 ribosomal protein L29 [Cavenderia fasciculata]|eukprot:XP_004354994.1 S60 ribosomal protein L29 [Cavenderia fasciculata]
MAKSKNHSTHHQERKNHRNGIKKPVSKPKDSLKHAGVDPKILRNIRLSRKNNKRTPYVRGDLQVQKPHPTAAPKK